MENKFFGDLDRYLFHHGTHYKLYEKWARIYAK